MIRKLLISCVLTFCVTLMLGLAVHAEVIAPTTVEYANGTYTTSGKNTNYAGKLVFMIALNGSSLNVNSVMYIDQSFVNSDGTYSFTNYKPKVDITNTSTKYDVFVSFSGVAARVSAGQMKMYVIPTKKISGTVTNLGKNTATVTLSQSGVTKYTATVNSITGAYSIDAVPGTYKVVVSKQYFLSETINSFVLNADKTENFFLYAGDVNSDGIINMTDLTALISAFGKSTGESGYNAACDVDNNGVVNLSDIGYIIQTGVFGKTSTVR